MRKQILSVSILAVFIVAALSACSSSGLAALEQSVNRVQAQGAMPVVATQAPGKPLEPPAQSAPVTNASGDLLAVYQGTLENLYEQVSPSVVNIRVVKKVDLSSAGLPQGFPFFNNPNLPDLPNLPDGHPALPDNQQPDNQLPGDQYEAGLGSGFVWDEQGHIVTNNHVAEGADKIEVTFSDGTTVPATLVGADPDSDLAVIKVDVPADQLRPVTLADSNAVKVGQLAIAIGNPFGLEGTMTTGIVSALGRSLPANESSLQSYTIPDVIQTDAPINPGNSGGVLVDIKGQVLGVTTAIRSTSGSNSGIGFAVPSAIVNNVVPALISDGRYVHAWLGISGTSLVPDLATAMKLDAGQRGALVGEVIPNSPAEEAGLQGSSDEATIDGQQVNVGGDVITAIDGQKVTGMDDLIAYLVRNTTVGQKVTLTILRNGSEQTVDVTLAARPSSSELAQGNDNSNNNGSNNNGQARRGVRLGIQALTVNAEVANAMNLDSVQQGVLVVRVEPGSLAENAGLQAGTESASIGGEDVMVDGDIITAVNGQEVTSLEELRAALAQLPADQELTLSILRNGQQMDLTANPGL